MIVIHLIAPDAAGIECEHSAGRVSCNRRAALLAVRDGSDIALCPECFCELARLDVATAVPFVLTPEPRETAA